MPSRSGGGQSPTVRWKDSKISPADITVANPPRVCVPDLKGASCRLRDRIGAPPARSVMPSLCYGCIGTTPSTTTSPSPGS